jgi:hypothetical protein
MRIPACLIATVALTRAFAADQPSDIHIALTVLQPGSMGKLHASQLARSSVAGAGERLQVRIAVAKPCHGIVVGFDAAGKVAWPDQPAVAALEANDQRLIPADGGWKWEDSDAVRELDILIVDNRSAALPALAQLTQAMQAPSAPAVRVRQIAELRRMIDALTPRSTTGVEYSLKTDPVPLGGLLRGDVCDWCKDAWRISLPAAGSYVVRQRFPVEAAR